MKKYFFSLLLLIVAVVHSNSQSIFGPIEKKVVQEILPELFGSRTQTVLSKTQVIKIIQKYPAYRSQLEQSGELIYYQGKIYKSQKDLLNEYRYKPKDDSTQRVAARELYGKKATYRSQKNQINGQTDNYEIRRIQHVLNVLGYKVKYDGIMGSETRSVIQNAFRIDCDGLTDKQICDLVFNKRQESFIQKSPVYELSIKRQNEEVVVKRVDITSLNKELKDYSCGIDEICAKTNKEVGGSMQFACSDPNGNNVIMTLSTEKSSMEINLKSPDGNTAKFALNSDGKLSITSSDGKYTRTVNSNINKD